MRREILIMRVARRNINKFVCIPIIYHRKSAREVLALNAPMAYVRSSMAGSGGDETVAEIFALWRK